MAKVLGPVVSRHPMSGSTPGETIMEVRSDGGGCLVSLMVRDGRLRIEVYRADDTVDMIAPARKQPVAHISHMVTAYLASEMSQTARYGAREMIIGEIVRTRGMTWDDADETLSSMLRLEASE